ncbi:MAG: trypsin-like peptidase domain-containing protein [Pirellulales bacterium]
MSRDSHRRGSRTALGVGLLIVLLSAGGIASLPLAHGQTPLSQALSPEQREQQYDQLARDYAQFEQQFSLLKRVVKLVSGTVVHIEATHDGLSTGTFSARGRTEEAGSGVLVDLGDKMYVLTNRHVIKESPAGNIKVKLEDGRIIHPVRTWSDRETDVAVMEVEDDDLVSARLGNSDEVEIGDFVVAVGSPFGLSRSVTYGIISAKGRHGLELGDDQLGFQDFLQTDAAINPGNSGGPLINLRGEVIGINTAIASASGGNEGIGFSIPINMVKAIAQRLIVDGHVVRAFLGVKLDAEFGPTMASRMGLPVLQGAKISAIIPDSPAAASQLQVEDVIFEFDGVRIVDDNHLVNIVSLTDVGKSVPVSLYRHGQSIQTSVQVGNRGEYPASR